ncbi:DUF4340 domain-containing protein [Hirschia maritima]|uniref:DUF4340 domain-containing protein n=1 Tax=Hirschia maritima TaxID=1121961 RepID=UPI00036FE355|nr:DUF4340 domain-containing protein [Hirschia maritima]
MSIAKKRSRILLGASALAALAIGMSFLSGMDLSRNKLEDRKGTVVLPAFEADVTAAEEIKVTTQEGSYHLRRDGQEWFLTERGRYPIRIQAIANLSEALASMTFDRQMTLDPKKFDSLGLGDPYAGGTGALMQVSNYEDDKLVDLIVGFKNGSPYIRKPDEMQTWAVNASVFPPLQNLTRWLDLDVINIGVGDIAKAQVEFADGTSYALRVKLDAPGRFELDKPFEDALLLADYTPNPPALALSRFDPIDVVPRDEIEGDPVAIHRTITHLGLVLEAELFRDKDKYWAVFSGAIEVERDATIAQLQDIEDKVAGWAFEISRMDFNIMTTPIEDIAIAPKD